MRHITSALAWLVATGCSVGTPVGFSTGDHWTFPLVGPLEDGLLLTPAMVHGHGPYLFAIDPDANVTEVDKQVVDDAALRIGVGPRRIDETNTGQIRVYAELLDFRISGLTIQRRDAMVFPNGLYDTAGRHINGILGRDAVADSLVFGFDRDHGIATLSTVKAFQPPPDAIAMRYEVMSAMSSAFVTNVDPQQAAAQGDGQTGVVTSDVTPVPRRLTSAQIGNAKVTMHLDLGAPISQLAEAKWAAAGLAPTDVKLHLVDEAATARDVQRAGLASDVMAAGTRTFQVTFVPYIDQRFGDGIDGALGLDFFRPYAVYASWDSHTYFLKMRGDLAETAVARFGRWGAAVPPCPHAGCVTAEIAGADGSATLGVVRDPVAAGRALEVFLGVTPAPGLAATPLVVELPAGADQLTSPLPLEYAGARLTVLDVSPFVRSCPADGGCVLQVGPASARRAAPPEGSPEAAGAQGAPGEAAGASGEAAGAPGEAAGAPGDQAAPAAPPRNVPLDKLHRMRGEAAISPSSAAKAAAGGKPFAAAIVRICLGRDGKVASTKLVKPSGVAPYDDELQAAIKASWAFSTDGLDGAVCTTATFVNH